MLTPVEAAGLARDLIERHERERPEHDRVYDFLRGRRGVPAVDDGATQELKDLARLSVKNVLKTVVDSFTQNLDVAGFRSPDAAENDPAWQWWQDARLDARQADAHRPAVAYGTSYAVVTNEGVRLRTPRALFAVYSDPAVDLWPQFAIEWWIDRSEVTPVRRGVLLDGEYSYPMNFGSLPVRHGGRSDDDVRVRLTASSDGAPALHGASVCPVVRFVNERDAEDSVAGEVSPLIGQQCAINEVNFDRLVVARFGAFPQKYAIGYEPSSSSELARLGASTFAAFADYDVKVGSFTQASIEPYNSLLHEMVMHVAMEARVSLRSFGSIANLSADALAMADAPHQRKLDDKRRSFGESWEQVIRLAGSIFGFDVSESAEVVWGDSEVRSFAQVVDGMVKLSQSGVPMGELLQDIPGWSQQRVMQVQAAMRRQAGAGILQRLRDQAPDALDA